MFAFGRKKEKGLKSEGSISSTASTAEKESKEEKERRKREKKEAKKAAKQGNSDNQMIINVSYKTSVYITTDIIIYISHNT